MPISWMCYGIHRVADCPQPLSYIEDFEQLLLKDYPGKTLGIWLRFVDDTFIIISKSESDQGSESQLIEWR